MKERQTTTQTTFVDLLRTYEQATRNRQTNEQAYTKALTDLATACAYSVLKKLVGVGGKVEEGKKAKGDSGHIFRIMKNQLTADLDNLNRLNYACNNSTRMTTNKDGDRVQEITNKQLFESTATLLDNVLNDGFDLVNTAIETILTETQKADTNKDNFLELPYTVRRLKKKVYIQSTESVNGWEEVETTPIQEIYKAIRRDIQASRQVQATSKYSYIADTIRDTETDTETEVYKRLPKYSGLAYEIDTDGKQTRTSMNGFITVDRHSVEELETLVTKLNLTDRQATILKLRLSGKGYKAIGTYMGITDGSVKTQVKEIRKKAVKIGLTPLDK